MDASQTFMTTVEISPAKKGTREIVATFNATELLGLDGSCEVEVKWIGLN